MAVFKYITTCFVGFIMLTAVAEANVVVRTADQLEVAEGDIVDGELVAIGLPVTLSNNVDEDATLIGNRVKVNGSVGGDLLAIGFFVDVDAPVTDDVRIFGGEVKIASDIAGDVLVFGGTVDILSTATIQGGVITYGGTVTLAGTVAGDVVGSMEALTVDATVGGGVDVSVTTLTLGQNASVTEAVRYTSYNLVSQSLNSVVAGEIVRSDPPLLQESGWPRMTLMVFLIGLFAVLVWYLLARKSLTVVVEETINSLVKSAVIGLLAPVVALVIVAVLFVSQLGMYVGIVLLFGFVTCLLLSVIAAAPVIGQLALRALSHKTPVGPLPIVLGSMILTACLYVPMVGGLLIGACVLITLGGLLESLFRANQ